MMLLIRTFIYSLLTVFIVSCGGASSTNEDTNIVVTTPNVTSFNSSSTSIRPNSSVNLTAVFANGTGSIDNGVGIVTSSTPILVQPIASTTYNLTVTNDTGDSVTSTVSVVVSPFATVNISWNANPETAVNRAGGGYTLFYSSKFGFNISDGDVTQIDVPYTFGAKSPTTRQVKLRAGTYYIRILAYSALNAPDTINGSNSSETPQMTLVVI